MATFALLQLSIAAVTSDWVSKLSGKPEVNITRVLRPGIVDIPLATLRRALSTLRMPKSADMLLRDVGAVAGARDATITGSSLGETDDPFVPATTFFSRFASAVKFCVMVTLPPNSAIAISRSGPALASMNFAAASRALA